MQVSLARWQEVYGVDRQTGMASPPARHNEYHGMANPLDMKGTVSGIAALSICESLLIALSDLKIMDGLETAGVLKDAANAHRNAGGTGHDAAMHLEVAAIIERIIAGAKSVPPP